ncbi:hypothetical protein ACWEN6_29700 [Sphaerisporangium sp. NPDC004334]
MTTDASVEEVLRHLRGKGVTQGWDVVCALSAHKVNELFQRQFVQDLVSGDHLPPISGTVPIIDDYTVEFADVVLGHPLIAFDPALDPQAARLTIPVVSGIARTVLTAGGAAKVVSTQWITGAQGYTITGTVPLGKVKGEVEHQTHVSLRIDDGKDFFADLGVPGATGTLLGAYFLRLLADPGTGYRRYALGTLDYTPNATDLTPAGDFELATQRDQADPADAGRLLLFVPTAYNPKGGAQTSLPLANVVPAGMDTTLLVSGRVLFGGILRDLVAGVVGAGNTDAHGDASDAWSVTVTGGSITMPVRYTSEYGTVQAGWCGKPQDVYVTLKDIAFRSSAGALTGTWSHDWQQAWSVEVDLPALPTICDEGQVTMTVELDTTYRPGVDPVTAEITFTSSGGVGVSFPAPDDSFFKKIDPFQDEQARQLTCDLIAKEIVYQLSGLFGFTVPHVGAFAVTNLLFPGRQTARLLSAHVPGDLVAFGTLNAPGFAVSPPLSAVTTAETVRLAADRPVTWSVPRGGGRIGADGMYTPPAGLSRPKVVVVTATARDPITVEGDDADGEAVRDAAGKGFATAQRAYAAVVVTPAQVAVAPIISVFEARDQARAFTARLPGSAEKVTWSISPAVGTVDDTGRYTPPAKLDRPVAVTLTARIGKESGSARIVVFPAAPVAVQVTPYAPAPLGPGAARSFTAALGGDPVRAEWSVLPEVGRIDQDGRYTAPETVPAPCAVLVVARDPRTPALGGTAVVLLTPDGDDTGAVIRPTPAQLPNRRSDDLS